MPAGNVALIRGSLALANVRASEKEKPWWPSYFRTISRYMQTLIARRKRLRAALDCYSWRTTDGRFGETFTQRRIPPKRKDSLRPSNGTT